MRSIEDLISSESFSGIHCFTDPTNLSPRKAAAAFQTVAVDRS